MHSYGATGMQTPDRELGSRAPIELGCGGQAPPEAPPLGRGVHLLACAHSPHRQDYDAFSDPLGEFLVAQGSYEPIAPVLFRKIKAQRLLLEYDDARSGSFEPLRHVPMTR